jgi:hypothetical protein
MVVFGDAPPPPSPTDPNVGYPPDFHFSPYAVPDYYYAEGFAYSFGFAAWSPGLLQFGIRENELWSDWCAMQTPIDDSGICLPNWQGGRDFGTNGNPDRCYQRNPATREDITIDCNKYDLCMLPVCKCSTTNCVYFDNSGAMFVLQMYDNTATGSVRQLIGSDGLDSSTVHFTRDP